MLAYLRGSPDLLRRLGAVPMEPGLYGRPHGRVGIACTRPQASHTIMNSGVAMSERLAAKASSKGAEVDVQRVRGEVLFWPLVEGAEK